jgi:hypothetical protein
LFLLVLGSLLLLLLLLKLLLPLDLGRAPLRFFLRPSLLFLGGSPGRVIVGSVQHRNGGGIQAQR